MVVFPRFDYPKLYGKNVKYNKHVSESNVLIIQNNGQPSRVLLRVYIYNLAFLPTIVGWDKTWPEIFYFGSSLLMASLRLIYLLGAFAFLYW